jgi:hypothetical protein
LADIVGLTEPGTIRVNVEASDFAEGWKQSFPGRAVPTTTLPNPVFVTYSLLVEDGCPGARIDAIVIDPQLDLVYGDFSRTPGAASCGDVAGSHTFVVAIRRAAIPTGLMTFRLEEEFSVCADCGRELEEVTVTL